MRQHALLRSQDILTERETAVMFRHSGFKHRGLDGLAFLLKAIQFYEKNTALTQDQTSTSSSQQNLPLVGPEQWNLADETEV